MSFSPTGKIAVDALFGCACNARAFVQQLSCDHSLLVYPVKSCQVAREGMAAWGGGVHKE
jgi:hypothetical protein